MRKAFPGMATAVAVLLAGCGGGGAAPPASSTSSSTAAASMAPDFRRIASTTEAAATANLEMTTTSSGKDVSKVTGGMDYGNHRASLSGTLMGMRYAAVIDGTTMYQRYDSGPLMAALGGKWVKLDTGASDRIWSAPATPLALLRGAADVRQVGSEVVRGTATTHYRATVDLVAAAQASDQDLRSMGSDRARKVFGDSLPMDLWVDDGGRLRKATYEVDLSRVATGSGGPLAGKVDVSIELFDFGAPVEVKVPQPSDVSTYGTIPGMSS